MTSMKQESFPEDIEIILATDVGSTTTKARLFRKIGGEYRFVCSGEAPTTVEKPFEDITMGILNAAREVEELSGLRFIAKDGKLKIRKTRDEKNGVDLYVSTSSAGGGLQMIVFGVTRSITGESAERAALGGGAIVMNVITLDDGKPSFEKIESVRFLRPDIVLISGAVDGGPVNKCVELGEILLMADPKPRFGVSFRLPVIYAGNKDARDQVSNLLKDKFIVEPVDNIRPSVESENADPCRNAIQRQFMEHVMSHAPGYEKLATWVGAPIMPTPYAEGMMFQTVAKAYNTNVIGVGLGGATTNVYSIYDGKFVRTVSANLGMSYSICNVVKEAGIENVCRWIPFSIEHEAVYNMALNKMIRPTTLPQTLEELFVEHAVAREAIRIAFNHHKSLAKGLRGVHPVGEEFEIFTRKAAGYETYIDMLKVGLIGGTGGLLSRAPRRCQSALILIDAFQPEGVTKLIQDSVFMMPHLGVLSTVHSRAAMEIFEKDCVVRLGTCIAPRGIMQERDVEVFRVELHMPNGSIIRESLKPGEIKRVSLQPSEKAAAILYPHKEFDLGAGFGKTVKTDVEGGVVGLILDARGRPLALPQDEKTRKNLLIKWFKAMDVISDGNLKKWAEEDA